MTASLADPGFPNHEGMTVVHVGNDSVESHSYPLDEFPETV